MPKDQPVLIALVLGVQACATSSGFYFETRVLMLYGKQFTEPFPQLLRKTLTRSQSDSLMIWPCGLLALGLMRNDASCHFIQLWATENEANNLQLL